MRDGNHLEQLMPDLMDDIVRKTRHDDSTRLTDPNRAGFRMLQQQSAAAMNSSRAAG